MAAEAVKVAVRVRPFNGREKEANSRCIIRVRLPRSARSLPFPAERQRREGRAAGAAYR